MMQLNGKILSAEYFFEIVGYKYGDNRTIQPITVFIKQITPMAGPRYVSRYILKIRTLYMKGKGFKERSF